MKLARKLLAGALCAALLLTGAGCGGTDTTWAYRHGDDTMPAGVYILGQLAAYGTPRSNYVNENWEAPSTKDLLKGETEGQNTADWLDAQGKRAAKIYYGVQALADQHGVALDFEDLEGLSTTVESVWSGDMAYSIYQYEMYYGEFPANQFVMRMDGTMLEQNGVAKSSLSRFFEIDSLKSKLFTALYGEGGAQEVGEAELLREFDSRFAKAYYFAISKDVTLETDAEGEVITEENESNVQALADAEAYAARLNSGEDFVDVVYDYRLSLADSEDEVEVPELENFTTVFDIPEEPGEDDLQNTVVATQVGRAAVVELDYAIYVVQRTTIADDEALFQDYREYVLQQYKMDEFEELLIATAEALPIEENAAAIQRYTASKLKVE